MYKYFKLPGQPIHPTALLIAVSLFVTLTGNITFLTHLNGVYPFASYIGFSISLFIIVFCVTGLLSVLMTLVLSTKTSLALLLFITALAGYFSDKYGVAIDVDMIRNTLETNPSEALDMLSWGLLLRLLFLAVLPLLVVSSCRIRKQFPGISILHKGLTAIGFSLIISVCVFTFSSQYASFIREHKPLRYYINPIHPIYSSFKYLSLSLAAQANNTFVMMTTKSSIPKTDVHRELVIVVVGETARADHFSLNGYQRLTNPLLARESNIVNFTDIASCGTSTAISVPCMFSVLPREKFDVTDAKHTENVLDILAKANISVVWRDNNSDAKGVADRVPYQSYRSSVLNLKCDTECRDVGMLEGLQEYIDNQEQDILIVLHQMGSHGPAYYKRYPPEFEVFTPACQSKELSSCTDQQIINAYDNSIVYTDYFLSQVIGFLKHNTPKYETAMLYVSDHGESLGENNVYLHGLPYAFAPDSQKKIPIIAWIGESSDIDFEKTLALKDIRNTHDAVSLAILAAFEIESDVEFSNISPLIKMSEADK